MLYEAAPHTPRRSLPQVVAASAGRSRFCARPAPKGRLLAPSAELRCPTSRREPLLLLLLLLLLGLGLLLSR